jgi:hypothetical protein
MIVRDSEWEHIRMAFSEDEKVQLRAAIRGEAICPRGVIVDLDSLPESLRQKLEAQLRGMKVAGVAGLRRLK